MADATDDNETSSAEAAFAQLEAKLDRLVESVHELTKRVPDVAASVRAFEQQGTEIKQTITSMAAMPALRSTPAQHMQAGAVAAAKEALPLVSELGAALRSASTLGNSARDTIGHVWILGFVAGLTALACAFLFLGLPRLVHGPAPKPITEMTAQEKWELAVTLAAEASPKQWNQMVRSYNLKLDEDELTALETCNTASQALVPPQPCGVRAIAPRK